LIRSFDDIPTNHTPLRAAVPGAYDRNTLLSLELSRREDALTSILIGNRSKIEKMCGELDIDTTLYRIEEAHEEHTICHKAIDLCNAGEADILVKGMVSSPSYLSAILEDNKSHGIKRFVNQLWIFEYPQARKLLVMSDGALIISPDLLEKKHIIENCVDFCHKLGIPEPRVAVLAPLEKVNPRIPSSVDAALLNVMNQRGQIGGCLVEGPLALDNAISAEAMERKSIKGKFRECADILVVPDLDTGNVLGKAFTCVANLRSASLLWGTRFPSVISSRSGAVESKMLSIRLAAYIISRQKNGEE